jgi:hypothetical protein
VFGQVVADDALGDIYMVPLSDILDDVRDVLAARDARLPESNIEIENIRHRPYDTTVANRDMVIDATTSIPNPDPSTLGQPLATLGSTQDIQCSDCGSYEHTQGMCKLQSGDTPMGELDVAQPEQLEPHTLEAETVPPAINLGGDDITMGGVESVDPRSNIERGDTRDKMPPPPLLPIHIPAELPQPPSSTRLLIPEPPKQEQFTNAVITPSIPATTLNSSNNASPSSISRSKVYRWQCCNCGGNNSCVTDASCVFCYSHQYCDCCYTYDFYS